MNRFRPRGLGWHPDVPDFRDFSPDHLSAKELLGSISRGVNENPRDAIDLRKYFVRGVPNQADLNASTVFTTTALVEYFEFRSHGRFVEPSALFLYHTVPRLQSPKSSSRGSIRAAIKTMVRLGIPPEDKWSDENRDYDAPSNEPMLYSFAEEYRSIRYVRLDKRDASGRQTLEVVKAFLRAGFPVVFGFPVPASLTSKAKIEFRPTMDSVRGGQAVIAAGYDDNRISATGGALLIRSSWGPHWGKNGYGWLPYRFVEERLAVDFWTIKLAANTAATAPSPTPASVLASVVGAVPASGDVKIAVGNALAAVADKAVKATGADAAAVKKAVDDAADGIVDQAAAETAPRTKALIDAKNLKLEAASEGTWGNSLRMRIDHNVSQDVADRLGLNVADLFNLSVKDMLSGVTESFVNLSFKPGPMYVRDVLKSGSTLVRTAEAPSQRPDKHADLAPGTDPFDSKVADAYSEVNEEASNGKPLGSTAYIGSPNEKSGTYALDDIDLFNLLCIPEDQRGDGTESQVYSDALSYCKKRRAMLIVDPPKAWTDQAGVNKLKSNPRDELNGEQNGKVKLAGDDARNAAIFFPRIRQADPQRNGQIDTFVPCGMIAGIMARTDSTRGVWKAPAGLDASLNGVHSLAVKLTDAENGILNPVGINCLRSFPASGNVVWGARTLRGDDQLGDEYKYIPVRRTALFIEESLYRGTQWAVFEPNDEPLWAQLRLNIGAFMHTLFQQGAFQGQSPRDAYFVKCDKETTPQNFINLGVVNVIVGFAPLKPAEFVVIKLTQIAGQIAT